MTVNLPKRFPGRFEEFAFETFSLCKHPHERVLPHKQLLEAVKEFAKEHKLFINDVIEYSVNHIDVNKSKSKNHKNRIEIGL